MSTNTRYVTTTACNQTLDTSKVCNRGSAGCSLLHATEYAPGIGWMYVTNTGRYGNFETENQALAARAQAIGD